MEKKYFCYNCKSKYSISEITFNGNVSIWCPCCFKLGESPNDCVLEVFKDELD